MIELITTQPLLAKINKNIKNLWKYLPIITVRLKILVDGNKITLVMAFIFKTQKKHQLFHNNHQLPQANAPIYPEICTSSLFLLRHNTSILNWKLYKISFSIWG